MDLTILESLRAKLGLANASKPALVGLAALFVMVAVFAGRFIIDTATATEISIEHDSPSSQAAGPTDEGLPASSDASASEQGAGNAQTIFVHVSGAVAEPGLVELVEGSRIADAVQAAGGMLDEGVAESVNLARKLNDGEQIHIMSKDEVESGVSTNSSVMAAAQGNVASSAPNTGLININAASQAELESLPGVGPSTAAKIVSDRDANGPFSTPEDLMRVTGIGEKKFASIVDLICV